MKAGILTTETERNLWHVMTEPPKLGKLGFSVTNSCKNCVTNHNAFYTVSVWYNRTFSAAVKINEHCAMPRTVFPVSSPNSKNCPRRLRRWARRAVRWRC